MTRSGTEEIAARIDAQVREIKPLLPAKGRSFRKIARLWIAWWICCQKETIEEINSGKLSQNTLICPSNSWLFPVKFSPQIYPGIQPLTPERQFTGVATTGGPPASLSTEGSAWSSDLSTAVETSTRRPPKFLLMQGRCLCTCPEFFQIVVHTWPGELKQGLYSYWHTSVPV